MSDEPLTPFKLRTEVRGAHVHVDVFVLNRAGNTYQLAGHVVLDDWQWEKFNVRFTAHEPLADSVSGLLYLIEHGAGHLRNELAVAHAETALKLAGETP